MAHLSCPCCNRAKWSCFFILFLSLSFWCKNIHKGISIVVPIVSCAPIWPPTNHFLKDLLLAGLPQITFLKGLAFPRSAKVISQKVWHFRARRKSFPEWFGISAAGESRFPKGLAFPRLAKVIFRRVWCFRAWRKLFPEWFGISCCKNMEINGSA